jgi:anthranilate phosphoribosyltransferase
MSRSLIVHTNLDNTPIGLDELAPIGTPVIQDIQGKSQQLLDIKPTTINNAKTAITNILSGLTVDDSVSMFHQIIQGEVAKHSFTEWLHKTNQPISPEERFSFCYELVIQNAALGFIAANKSESLEAGIALATETIASKTALNTFKRYQDAYNVYCP